MTIQELRNKRLREYLRAEEAILGGAQSYLIGDRHLTRADLGEVRRAIEDLLSAGAYLDEADKPGRIKVVVFE